MCAVHRARLTGNFDLAAGLPATVAYDFHEELKANSLWCPASHRNSGSATKYQSIHHFGMVAEWCERTVCVFWLLEGGLKQKWQITTDPCYQMYLGHQSVCVTTFKAAMDNLQLFPSGFLACIRRGRKPLMFACRHASLVLYTEPCFSRGIHTKEQTKLISETETYWESTKKLNESLFYQHERSQAFPL